MILNSILWEPSPYILKLGGFEVRWYGVLFALGFFFAYILLMHIFKREKVSQGLLDKLTIYVFIATLIGARLGHCLFYEWFYYKDHLWEILMVWEGGLASHGAAIAILIALIIYMKKFKVNIWWLFDRVAMAIPIAAAFVRFGNLFNSEIYGHPTNLPWGFVFVLGEEKDNLARHPTQLYEAFSYLLITVVLYIIYRKKQGKVKPGLFVGIFVFTMFVARFLIEFLKMPQETFESGWVLDMGQWLSIPFIILGAVFIVMGLRGKLPSVAPIQMTSEIKKKKEK